jgi:hypothetical protein
MIGNDSKSLILLISVINTFLKFERHDWSFFCIRVVYIFFSNISRSYIGNNAIVREIEADAVTSRLQLL